MQFLYQIVRKSLFSMDAEKAHNLILKTLSLTQNLVPRKHFDNPVKLMGLHFPNRLGLAAGLDKNAVAFSAFDHMGFGFIEVGTTTPKAQDGNPKPRIFRVLEKDAIINRMGFPNLGVENLVENLKVHKRGMRGILGVNIGKNKATPLANAYEDYLYCMEKTYEYADYLAINISSPNTQGLRDLLKKENLEFLLDKLVSKQRLLDNRHAKHIPLVVKISPDNTRGEFLGILEAIKNSGVEGIIVSNTTIDRSQVLDCKNGGEIGGLSGAPLMEKSTNLIREVRRELKDIAIIASGGVLSAEDFVEKLNAGADLVQIYTGFIYKGPALIKQCLRALE